MQNASDILFRLIDQIQESCCYYLAFQSENIRGWVQACIGHAVKIKEVGQQDEVEASIRDIRDQLEIVRSKYQIQRIDLVQQNNRLKQVLTQEKHTILKLYDLLPGLTVFKQELQQVRLRLSQFEAFLSECGSKALAHGQYYSIRATHLLNHAQKLTTQKRQLLLRINKLSYLGANPQKQDRQKVFLQLQLQEERRLRAQKQRKLLECLKYIQRFNV